VVVEIQDWNHVVVHRDVAETVDTLLRGYEFPGEIRTRDTTGTIHVEEQAPEQHRQEEHPSLGGRSRARSNGALQSLRVYPFGISRNRLEQAVRELRLPVTVTNRMDEAELVLTLKNYYRRKPEPLRDAESHGVPVYVLKNNTIAQMQGALASVFNLGSREKDPDTTAMEEAEQAIGEVIEQSRTIELAPQNSHVRRLQHQLAERYNVGSRSRGKEPNRRVKFFPREFDELV
jgi:R3H domain